MSLRSIEVSEWREIPEGDILAAHGRELYDLADPKERARVELKELPLLNDEGQENRIYDGAGTRVPHREAIVEENQVFNGMLFDLQTLHQLFQRGDVEEEDEGMADQPMTAHELYPMAGLKTIGHFQAHGLMTPFLSKMQGLNRTLKRRYHGDDEEHIAAELLSGYSPLIEGIACQGYNMLSHRVRAQGRYHEVQLGQMTAAFSGTHETPTTNQNIASKMHAECMDWLPYERFHEKISGMDVDTSTRIENVYRVSLRRIPEHSRNGR